jgi:hypothetical protein
MDKPAELKMISTFLTRIGMKLTKASVVLCEDLVYEGTKKE